MGGATACGKIVNWVTAIVPDITRCL